eukprot:2406455-Rhodomonas_salina.4
MSVGSASDGAYAGDSGAEPTGQGSVSGYDGTGVQGSGTSAMDLRVSAYLYLRELQSYRRTDLYGPTRMFIAMPVRT